MGRQPLRGRLIPLVGILLVAFSARQAVSAVSPLLGQISEDLPLDAVTTGILRMLPTAGFAAMGFLALPLLRRTRPEHLLLASILLTTFGQVGRALAWASPVLLAFTAITMLGIGTMNVVGPPLLMKYFPDKTGILPALHVTLLAVSTAVAPQAAIPLAGMYGWRFSIGIWAAISAATAVPWLMVLAAKGTAGRVRKRPARGVPPPGPSVIKPWRSSIGWGMALIFAGCSSNTFAATTIADAVVTAAAAGAKDVVAP